MRCIIDEFSGIRPKAPRHALRRQEAVVARDVDLRNGRLQAWRERKDAGSVEDGVKSFFPYGCCLLQWDECVHAATYLPDYEGLYVSGRTAYAERVALEGCDPYHYRLGVPAPTKAPTVAAVTACDRDVASRAYFYTYVNRFGEESAPSLATNQLSVHDGASVTVSGFIQPDAAWGVVGWRLYRSCTAFRDPKERLQDVASDFLLVASGSFPTSSFTDSRPDQYVGPVCETRDVRCPPVGIQNICEIPTWGVLAGSIGNRVLFSENYEPWNWPVMREFTMDANVVHLASQDDRLFVTTDKRPYIFDLSNQKPFAVPPVGGPDLPLPDIAAQHVTSFCLTPRGLVYSTKEGLVLLTPDGRHNILTTPWYGPAEWARMSPETVRLAYWETFLFCVTDQVGFVLHIADWNDVRGWHLAEISDRPTEMRVTEGGELLMLEGGHIWQWNAGHVLRPYVWESSDLKETDSQKEYYARASFPTGAYWSPASLKGRVPEGSVEVTVKAVGAGVGYTRSLTGEEPVRLPRMGRHMAYRLRVEGTGTVDFLEIGTSHRTVNQGA